MYDADNAKIWMILLLSLHRLLGPFISTLHDELSQRFDKDT